MGQRGLSRERGEASRRGGAGSRGGAGQGAVGVVSGPRAPRPGSGVYSSSVAGLVAAAARGVAMSGLQAGAEQRREEPSAPASSASRFVLGLDVGSTVIRCHVYDRTTRVRGSSAQKVTGRGGRVWGSGCTLAPSAPLGTQASVARCLSLASCPTGFIALALPGWN